MKRFGSSAPEACEPKTCRKEETSRPEATTDTNEGEAKRGAAGGIVDPYAVSPTNVDKAGDSKQLNRRTYPGSDQRQVCKIHATQPRTTGNRTLAAVPHT
jgi:hypothetical protein